MGVERHGAPQDAGSMTSMGALGREDARLAALHVGVCSALGPRFSCPAAFGIPGASPGNPSGACGPADRRAPSARRTSQAALAAGRPDAARRGVASPNREAPALLPPRRRLAKRLSRRRTAQRIRPVGQAGISLLGIFLPGISETRSHRRCEAAQAAEAIQGRTAVAPLDCFAALAMTGDATQCMPLDSARLPVRASCRHLLRASTTMQRPCPHLEEVAQPPSRRMSR